MADPDEMSMDAPSDMHDFPDFSLDLVPPPEATYPDKETLITAVQAHGRQYGYNVVTKTSSTPSEKKPGRVAKVWLRCDRGGNYRPRNGLTEETRKRKRKSRLMNCPFMILASGSNGLWTVKVENAQHNHGPVMEPPRARALAGPQRPKSKKGQIEAVPYDWPHDASFGKATTALVIIDMQRDFCEPGGYLSHQGYDTSGTQALIVRLKQLLDAFRAADFPIYHTREGHRSDLSTLSSREHYRSHNNATGFGIGSQGPLGRLLIRGEPGHDIVEELRPLPNEPIIDKPGRGAFAHTDFELLLRIKGIKNLVIAGVTTDVCVSTTMREANDRGYDCLLIEDGTAASEENLHLMTCDSVRMEGGIFGATGKIDNLIDALEALPNTFSKSATKLNQAIPTSLPDSPVTPTARFAHEVTSAAMSAGLGLQMSADSMEARFISNMGGPQPIG